jgi:hypothetical protein
MINDQLRELRARLDQLEQIALATPAENWPETFDALLDRWELGVATAAAREGSDDVLGSFGRAQLAKGCPQPLVDIDRGRCSWTIPVR